jgi:hypothetical protein
VLKSIHQVQLGYDDSLATLATSLQEQLEQQISEADCVIKFEGQIPKSLGPGPTPAFRVGYQKARTHGEIICTIGKTDDGLVKIDAFVVESRGH